MNFCVNFNTRRCGEYSRFDQTVNEFFLFLVAEGYSVGSLINLIIRFDDFGTAIDN